MRHLINFLVVLVFFSFGSVEGAGKISGKVTDFTTGNPISGVTIQIRLGGLLVDTEITNSSGTYTSDNLLNGIYSVTAILSSYQSVTNSSVTVFNGNVNSNFQLVGLGSISGTITNISNSAVISGATVQMIQSGTVISSTTTGSNGNFSISSLPPGSYTLNITAPLFQANTAAVTITSNVNTSKSVALTPNPGNVSGSVSSSSIGLSGATLTFSLSGKTVATVTSGLLGAYSVTNLPPATYSVSVNLANFQTATGSAVVTSNTTATLNFNLLPLAGTLSGTVKDTSGNNLTGATITVSQGSTIIATSTGGTYSIPDLSPGNYTVTTSLANYQTLKSSVTITTNATTTLNPALQALPGNVNGIITNTQTSLALAGASVKVTSGLIVVGSTTADSSGNFSISGIAAGSYTLTATLANFVSFSQSITIGAGGTVTQNIGLTPVVGIVTGIVQDLASLSLLGGATVDLLQGSTVVATTTTGLAGLYSFSVLPGTYSIRVAKANYVTATVSATVLSNLTATVNVTLIASPGTVSGQIANLITTAPLNNVAIQVLQGGATVASTTTNSSGNYSISGLAPGSYTLSASLANYSTATTPIVIASNLTTTSNVNLQPQNGSSSVIVKNSTTSALLPGATVGLYQGAILIASGTTDVNGIYLNNTLLPGSYTLTVSALNYQTVSQSIVITSNATTTTNLNLSPLPGVVTGVVTNSLTSALLSNATVTLTQGSVSVASTTTNSLGVYNLTGIIPGTYTATVSLSNFTTVSQSIVVNANATTTQNFTLQPQSGTVSGQIKSSLTAGVLANVVVNAMQGSTIIASTTTDVNGNYSLSLPPGSYTISGNLINYQTASQSLSVSSNVTTTVSLSLTPTSGIVSGTVTSQSTSLPLSGVSVSAMQGSTIVATAQTNVFGSYNLSNLAPGSYVIQFSLNNYQTVSQTKTVASSTTTTADAALMLQPGSISGVITNGLASTPFSGVTVTALQGATVIASATSQSNGSYTITSLPPGIYTVSVTAANFQTATQNLVTVTANGTTTSNLTLQPISGSVAGAITDNTTTNPIGGAIITLLQNGVTKGSAISLVNGSYTVTGLFPGTYTLVVNATNYQSTNQSVTVNANGSTSVSVALVSNPGAISGFVRNSSLSPLSGASVEVLIGSNVIASTITASNGSYTISNLAPAVSGTYTFRASAANHQTATQTATIIAGITEPISFALAPQPGALSGTVKNAQNGVVISGATVQVLQSLIVINTASTASDGSYTVTGLAPGSYTVVISAPNFQTSTQSALISANTVTPLNTQLSSSPGILSGIITDSATSNPIALVNVSVWNQGVLVGSAITLGNGSYSIGNLMPGNYTVVASLTSYQNSSVSTSIFANQTTQLNLSLQSLPGFISGSVLNGVTPIAGATVTIKNGNNVVATTSTDVSGSYTSIGLSPGSYTVTVSASTFQSLSQGALVLSNVTTPSIFNLVPFPGSVTGIIQDATTLAPISNAIVTALNGNLSLGSAVTANDGSYTIEGLSPGAYIITAVALNYQTWSSGISIQAGVSATVNLKLSSQPGSLNGRITDALSFAGIMGATVNISKDNIQVVSLLTDVDGYYSGTGLAPGSYTVTVQAENYQSSVKGAIILPNTASSLNFALLGSPGIISGQVVANASVSVYLGSLLIASHVSDSSGNFVFNNLAQGSYTVVASAINYQSASQSAIVTANVTTNLTFNLQPSPGNCFCSVLDSLTALPLEGAIVTLLQGNVTLGTTVTSALGECVFPGLAPGSYTIRVNALNHQGQSQGITIQADQTTLISLSLLSDPGSIKGVITDLITGAPISAGTIDIISNGLIVSTVTTDNNGVYLVNSLTPGLYTVRAQVGLYQTALQVVTVIANGTASLNIGLQPEPGRINLSLVDSISASAIAGASVTLYNPLNNTAIATAITDALGNCVISGLAPGLYTAVVNATNYQSLSVGVTVIANIAIPLNLNLSPNPGSIHCLIRDVASLFPIKGCIVEAIKNTTVIASAITSDLGECLLSGLAPGSYTIRITANNYQISTRAVIILPNIQSELEINLLSDVGTLVGEITDFINLAILPGAQLSLFSGQTLIATTVSDLFGNYIFTSLAPGQYTLRVSLLNFETFSIVVTIGPNQETHQPCSMHSNPGNISGTVLDQSTSNPIIGAEITVLNGNSSVADVFTDASGNYTIPGLKPHVNYTVRVTATNYQGSAQGVFVQANQTKVVNFSLVSQPGSLSGKVIDSASSQVIANASIDILQGSIVMASTTTDASGDYLASSLAPGSYTVRAVAATYQTKTVSATVAAAQVTTANIALVSNPGQLQGSVLDSATSMPLVSAEIQIRSGSILINSVATDQNGSYLVSNLAPGSYTVTAGVMNYQTLAETTSIQVNQTTTLNFNLLASPGSIQGVVNASLDGSAIAGASVSLYVSSTLIAQVTTDTNGNYQIPNLAPNVYTISVGANNFQGSSKGIQVYANQQTTANFSLGSSPGSIGGTVTGTMATIDLLQGTTPLASTVTAEDGSYSFINLAPGSYTLRIQANNYQTKLIGANVVANMTTQVNVTLVAENGNIQGTVISSTSSPLGNVAVEILQNGAIIASTLTNASGEYFISNLAPGSYVARATLDTYQIGVLGTTIQPSSTATVNFTLNPVPGDVSGQIIDGVSGSLLANVEVTAMQGSIVIGSALTDGNGNYLIENLAPGSYVIRASLVNYETSLQAALISNASHAIASFNLTAQPGSIQGQVKDASTGLPITTAFVAVNIIQGGVVVGSAISDANANYQITGLPKGSYTLQISAPNYQTVSQGVVIVSNVASTADILLQPDPGAIQGVIRNLATNAPIGGVVVDIMQGSVISATLLTDNNGAYAAVQLAPGTYSVRAHLDTYQTKLVAAIVTSNNVTVANLQLQQDPGSITGLITDISGSPLVGSVVVTKDGSLVVDTVLSDANGNYSITGLSPGTYIIFSSYTNYQTAFASVQVTSNTATPVSFTLLAEPGSASGQITNLLLDPLPSVNVEILQNGIVIQSVLTDVNGRYSLNNLTPGQYTIRAQVANYQTLSQGILITANVDNLVNFTLASDPGKVVGVVTDGISINPIANATVQVMQGQVVLGTTQTDASGTYHFQSLAPGNYIVVVSALDYQTLLIGVSVQANGVSSANVALMPDPSTVIGTVLDSSTSLAIANVSVQVFQGSSLIGSALTDAIGSFSISGLKPGSYSLSLLANNYQSSHVSFNVISNQVLPLNLNLAPSPGSLSGNVLDSSSNLPIAGASVLIKLGENLITSQITDINGNWIISNLAPGNYTVVISASLYQTNAGSAFIQSNFTTAVNTYLAASPGSVTGLITDGVNPLSGAKVEVLQGSIVIESTLTDNSGIYFIGTLAQGSYTLRISNSNFGTALQGIVILANQLAEANLALIPNPGILVGQIIDSATSQPIQGVILNLLRRGAVVATATTDAIGTYQITDLAPGNYILSSSSDLYQAILIGAVINSNQTTTVNLSLINQPGSMSGQITDQQTGLGLASASISVINGQNIVATALSDSNGNYAVNGLKPGSYTIRVELNSYQINTQTALIASSTSTTINAALALNPGSISGQVTNLGGIPITSGSVVLHVIQGNVLLASTLTDSNGIYRIDNLAAGVYSISVMASGFQNAVDSITVQTGLTTTLDFALAMQPGSLSGVIKDINGPVSGAAIQLFNGTSPVMSTLTDSNGFYQILNLAPVQYTLQINAENHAGQTKSIIITANQTTTINATLGQNPGNVAGTLTDFSSGLPIQGVLINLVKNGSIIASALTDSQGNYQINGLNPGSYTLSISNAMYQTQVLAVTINAGLTTNVTVMLQSQPGSVSGIITTSNATPIPNALIEALQNGQVIASSSSDASGNYQLTGLKAGSYTLRAKANLFQVSLQGVNVEAGGITIANFSLLQSPGSVHGIVSGLSLPLSEAVIIVLQGDIQVASTTSSADGSYILANLPIGNYQLMAKAEGYQFIQQGITITPNAQLNVDFNLLPNPGDIQGQVIDYSTSLPIAGAFLSLFKESTFVTSVQSDANGNYTINQLSAGNYTLVASASLFGTATQGLTIIPSAVTAVNFSLISLPGIISGSIVNEANQPLSGAEIKIIQNQSIIASILTDSNGNYSIQGLGSGSYTVSVNKAGYSLVSQGAVVTSGATTNVSFILSQDTGTLAVHVLNSLASVTVQVIQQQTVLSTLLTDANGNVSFANLAPGSYSVRFIASGYQMAIESVSISSGQITTLNYSLVSSLGGLSGALLDGLTTMPIAGATVDVLQGQNIVGSILSDSSGSFNLTGLNAGSYIVRITAANYQVYTASVVISVDQVTNVSISLISNPGSVSGSITDNLSGLAAASAFVQIVQNSVVVATQLTDSNGNYLINNLAPGSYVVQVSGSHFQTAIHYIIIQPNLNTIANIGLNGLPGTIQGVVLDQLSQNPLNQVLVRVYKGTLLVASATTNSSGMYQITGLGQDTYQVNAELINYQTAFQSCTVSSSGITEVNFALNLATGSILGVIRDAATALPIGGASLSLFQGQILITQVLTDGNGQYHFGNLAQGSYSVVVTASNYQTLSQVFTMTAGASLTADMNLSTNPGVIRGQILDSNTSLPLSLATIQISNGQAILGTALTDAQGLFSIQNLSPGNYTITISKDNYQTILLNAAVTAGAESVINTTLRPTPATLSGVVAGNQPIAGATVQVLQGTSVVTSSLTDSSGNYVISGLAEGSYTIQAVSAGYQFQTKEVNLTAGANITVNFTLESNPGAIQGVVTDGVTPLANALIQVFNGTTVSASIFSDIQGAYLMPNLAPGNYTIVASYPGYQLKTQGVIVPAGALITTNFSLLALPSSVSGMVTSVDTSLPLAGVTIQSYFNNVLIAAMLTDINGQYYMNGLPAGSYIMIASLLGYQVSPAGLILPPNASEILNFNLLLEVGRLIGVLRDNNGLPIAGGSITVSQNNVVVKTAISNLDGTYTLAGLAPGSYSVSGTASSFQSTTQGIVIQTNQVASLDFALQRTPSTLIGIIVDVFSNPISDAQISLFQNGNLIANTQVTADGTFNFNRLGSGNFSVIIASPQYQTTTAGVILNAGETLNRTFTLLNGVGAIQGTVQDQMSFPLANASIAVSQGGLILATTLTDGLGNYSINNLSPGNYVITASLANFQTGVQAAIVAPNAITNVNFSLGLNIGSLDGTISDAALGTPISGANISLYNQGVLVATATTDTNGFYMISGLTPGNYGLNIKANAYQSISENVGIQLNTTTHVSMQLLGAPGAVQGIIESLGIPIVNASVAISVFQGNVLISSTLTDNTGSYLFTGLQPGSYILKASAIGYQVQLQAIAILANTTAISNFSLVPEVGTINGTLLDASSLTFIANAQIQLLSGSVVVDNTLSDANGNFAFFNLAPGTYILSVNAANYQIGQSSVQVTANNITSITAYLQANPGAVSGVITDTHTTQGVRGAVVDLFQGITLISSTLTDADGKYSIGQLAQGSYTLRVTATNYQTFGIGCVIQSNSTSIVNVQLETLPSSINGRITDSVSSLPISLVSVSILQSNQLIANVLTDNTGAYRITGLAAGTYTIQATYPNYQIQMQGITLEQGSSLEINLALLPNPGTIQGNITDMAYQPITGATVSVDILQGNFLVAQTLTDLNGFYSISNLVEGSYVIVVSAGSYQSASQGVSLFAGEVKTVNFQLNSNPGSISGTIIDATTILPIGSASVTVSNGSLAISSTLTDSNGAYMISGLAPGSYTVTVSRSLYQSATLIVSVAANMDTTANLSLATNPGTFIGVISDVNGNPISGVQISVFNNGILIGSTLTALDGSYQMTGLPVGNYILTAVASGYQSVSIGANVQIGQTVTENLTLQANPGQIQGQILDSMSQAIGNALIQVFQNNVLVGSTLADAQGNFLIQNLAQGTYIIHISAPGFQTVAETVTVISGQTTILNSTLPSNPGSIQGLIVDSLNAPLANINVQVFNGLTLVAQTTTDFQGQYSINGLTAADYSVTAGGQGFALSTQSATVLANQTTIVNFTLSSFIGSISGSIVSAITGNPIASASVSLFSGSILIATTLTDTNGLYFFSNIAAGTYSLRITALNYQVKVDTVIVINLQNTQADEILDPLPGSLSGHITDRLTGQPLRNVIITVFGGEFPIANTQSDNMGNYLIPSLAPGTYSVQFSLPLYEAIIQNVTIYTNANTVFNLELEPIPLGPGLVSVQPVKDKFATQTLYANRIQWSASPSIEVVQYRIYRDGIRIGEVPRNKLFFVDGNINRHREYAYTVTAVNSLENESLPVTAFSNSQPYCQKAAGF